MGIDMSKAQRKPFHEEIAEQLITQLKEGIAPWQVPWDARFIRERPYNAATSKAYQGRNSIALLLSAHPDPRWMRFNQAKEADYAIKKGSRGTRLQMAITCSGLMKPDTF